MAWCLIKRRAHLHSVVLNKAQDTSLWHVA